MSLYVNSVNVAVFKRLRELSSPFTFKVWFSLKIYNYMALNQSAGVCFHVGLYGDVFGKNSLSLYPVLHFPL